MPRLISSIAVCCAVVLLTATASAQDYILRPGPRGFDPRLNRYGITEEKPTPRAETETTFDPSRTNVRIELLMDDGGGAVEAQQWSRTLSGLGYSARIRRPMRDEKLEISEYTQGTLRFVSIVGTIDRRGNLQVGDRTFTPSQAAELKDWLASIKKYGAAGSPEGQPLWGLSPSQFDVVYKSLSQTVDTDVTGLPLKAAIARLPLPDESPLRFNATAQKLVDSLPGDVAVTRSTEGLTAGTALAYLLSEFGLGFFPERTPEGGVALMVELIPVLQAAPVDEDRASPPFWPVGWDFDTAAEGLDASSAKRTRPSRMELAPSMFQLKNIGFAKVPLVDALATAEKETGIPVLIDKPGIADSNVDLAKARANLPVRKTTWGLALRYAVTPNFLNADLRIDEAGHPLIWVTPSRRGK